MRLKARLETWFRRMVLEALKPELDDLSDNLAIELGAEIRIAAFNLTHHITRSIPKDSNG